MRARKTKDLIKCLKQKGFDFDSSKKHHGYYYLFVNGIKQTIYTYFSHGEAEYGKTLMDCIKKQLKFKNPKDAEDYFDCTMSETEYVKMLKNNNDI